MIALIKINIGKEFNKYPVGRYLKDGDANGEKFRTEMLEPALRNASQVDVYLDDAFGYGSSFLEEAFGGLVRAGHAADELEKRLKIVTSDVSLKSEILGYMRDAAHDKNGGRNRGRG